MDDFYLYVRSLCLQKHNITSFLPCWNKCCMKGKIKLNPNKETVACNSVLFIQKFRHFWSRREQHFFMSYIKKIYNPREYKNMCAGALWGFFYHVVGSISDWERRHISSIALHKCNSLKYWIINLYKHSTDDRKP